MRARIWVPLLLLIGAGVAVWQVETAKSRPPEIPFAHVMRETITSSVPTDGKVEPLEWASARAERPGAVQQILIKGGQHVAKGEELVRLDTSEVQADREAALSQIAQITADLEVIASGGRASDQTRIANDLARVQASRDQALVEYQKYQRMEAAQAATPAEVTIRKQKVEDLDAQIKALKDQKATLVAPTDRSSADGRMRSARAALQLADERLKQSVIRAPIEGDVYQFDLKPGAYLNAGDSVATIGRLDRVKVTVHVDERDLGRVKLGMPVRITWDALKDKEWKGTVNKLPEQVVALGSRQVGNVDCTIENPGGELKPGASVNVEIRAESVDGALTVPKEALRNENKQEGVYVLHGDTIQWRGVKLGIDNTTRGQVVDGLAEGDSVALITDKPLKDGMPVTAVYP